MSLTLHSTPGREILICHLRPRALERGAIAEYARDFAHALYALPGAGVPGLEQMEVRDFLGPEVSETIDSPADRRRVRSAVAQSVERIAREVAEGRPCLVHAELGHGLHREFWALHDFQRLAPAVPVVATIHDAPALCGNPCRYLRTEFAGATPLRFLDMAMTKAAEKIAARKKTHAQRRIAKGLDCAMALSRTGAEALGTSPLFTNGRIADIPHIHPVPLPSQTPARTREDNRPLRVVFFAFICPGKGIEELIDAFDLLARNEARDPSQPPLELIIRGGLSTGAKLDGYLQSLRERIGRSPRADHIVFEPGFVEECERDRLLQQADILALPFRTVAGRAFSSSSALRAMSLARPIVAARSNTMPEVLADGETALLYPEDDAAALAGCLRRLARSPELRERLGAAARRRLETHHSPEAVALRLAPIYANLLQEAYR